MRREDQQTPRADTARFVPCLERIRAQADGCIPVDVESTFFSPGRRTRCVAVGDSVHPARSRATMSKANPHHAKKKSADIRDTVRDFQPTRVRNSLS